MAKGWVTLNVREEVKEGLQGIYESDKKRPDIQKFGNWLDNLLTEIVDHDERVSKYGRLLEPIGFNDDHIILMDHWQGKHFFVQISAKGKAALFCQEDKSQSCMHVGFCLALPQVYKALINKGFRPPKYHVAAHKWQGAMDRTEAQMRDEDRKLRKIRKKEGWSDEDIRKAEMQTANDIEDIRNQVSAPDA